MAEIILEVWVQFLVELMPLFQNALLTLYALGVNNPIRVARAILEHSQVPDPLGRVPPLLVVSCDHSSLTQLQFTKDVGIIRSARFRI